MLPKVSEDCSQCWWLCEVYGWVSLCTAFLGRDDISVGWSQVYSTVQYGAVQWHLCSTPGTPGTMGSTVGTSTSWALHLGGDGEVLGRSVTVRG